MIGDYPTQLDKIDQWLYDNFGILPGACSSTENLRYSVARRVAEALWPKTQSLPSDVEEAAEKYCMQCNYLNEQRDRQEDGTLYHSLETDTAIDAFKAGAEWQKAKMPMPEDTVLFNKGVEEGKRLGRQELFEELRRISETGVLICVSPNLEEQPKED